MAQNRLGIPAMHQNLTLAPVPPKALIRAVQAVHPAAKTADWQPLTGGRTNHLWRVAGWVVKLYTPDSASPLFPNDPTAEARALRLFTPLAPTLRATGEGWLAYDHIPGEIWSGTPVPVAITLARLHQTPAQRSFRIAPTGSHAILTQAQRIAADCQGNLPPPPDTDVPATKHHYIHGDAVPGNIIVGPQGITLIDWQCPALGDPAEDLAAFLSPAMQWLYRGEVLTPDQERAFLNGYPNPEIAARYRALKPLFHWRMAAHCLWKSERGAADYAAALGLELAALSH